MSVCTLPVSSNILEVNLSMQVSDYFEIFDKQQGGFHEGYIPVDTRRKLNVHKTFRRRRTSAERLMYVQFTSCVYGDSNQQYLSKC